MIGCQVSSADCHGTHAAACAVDEMLARVVMDAEDGVAASVALRYCGSAERVG